MSGPESNYAEWIEKAENDLLNIRNNLAAERVPWDTVLFHAQQAAEKLLKALLVHRGEIPAKTHDLEALRSRCAKLEPALAALDSDCRTLSRYAVRSRYPGDLFRPQETEGKRAVEAAERVRTAVLALLPGRDGE